MFSNTHMFIADRILTQLKDCCDIVIDRKFFIYGSIKPDYDPKLIYIEHYEKDSMNFVLDEIKYLSSLPYSSEKDFLKRYSMRLGVVMHYLSDYFCHAHNNMILESHMLRHFIYEFRLAGTVRRLKKYITIPVSSMVPPVFSGDIINYLKARLESYKNAKTSCINDITWALEVSFAVCLYIINASLNNTGPSAA